MFGGSHAYVSPSWYRTQPAVPTWDYASVQVYGQLEPVTGEAGIVAALRTVSAHDLAGFSLETMPERSRARMIAGIRAFRLRPKRVETQWKMSQNRSRADREGVIAALRARDEDAVADLVEATLAPDA